MSKNKSKAIKIKKESLLPTFNNSETLDIIQNSLKSYIAGQKQLQQITDTLKPTIESITKQVNLYSHAINTLKENSALKEVAILRERIKKFAEQFKSYNLSAYKLDTKVPISLGIRRPPTAEEIADKVYQKIIDNIKSKPAIKDSLLNNNPAVNLPENTQWEDIKIKFINQFDVEVYCKSKFLKKYSHIELGFVRKKTKEQKPDKQWQLLQQLAIIYKNKKLILPTIENLSHAMKINNDACMKIKEFLSNKLRAAFGIEHDPFDKYDPDKGYQLKFTLEPESMFRTNCDPYLSGGKFIENYNSDKTKKYLDF